DYYCQSFDSSGNAVLF
nr:immunoglobulin light chain junction region [Macaca mulatta]MOX22016.1 immunoglobulin light chain junction region [Macaca mulatta]MOX22845.1 immunoglobulin light chain junction region [Macaca mulatta]